MRRRQLITSLVVTAATTAGFHLLNGNAAPAGDTVVGEVLIARVSDAMLGLCTTTPLPPDRLRIHLASALADFHVCRYSNLASHLPQLICAGHALTADSSDPDHHALLAQVYLLTTRILIKLDDQQLGWMAADRARVTADAAGHPLIAAEAARNLAVLARKAGRHAQALSIALTAADHPDLRGDEPSHTAQRGLLIQSAAYTLARTGDQQGMRQLTDHAAAIATELGGATLLRDHGGGFNPTTVQLHRISAENSAGDPSAAIAAARKIVPQTLPHWNAGPATTPTSPQPSATGADARTAPARCSPPNTTPPRKPTPAPPSTACSPDCSYPDAPTPNYAHSPPDAESDSTRCTSWFVLDLLALRDHVEHGPPRL